MLEREVEDWIATNPETLDEGLRIIGRQVPVPHGRIDLLGWRVDEQYPEPGSTITGGVDIIELKATALKEKDVGQVLRYKYDVYRVVSNLLINTPLPMIDPSSLEYRGAYQVIDRILSDEQGTPIALTPVLVGASIDDSTLASCRGAGIRVFTWHEADGEIRFEQVSTLGIWDNERPTKAELEQSWATFAAEALGTMAVVQSHWDTMADLYEMFAGKNWPDLYYNPNDE